MSLLRPLLTQSQIQERVRQLGRELSTAYLGQHPCFVGLMNGALFFLTDLVRETDVEMEIHCLRLASYVGLKSQGTLTGLEGLDGLAPAVRGRPVLIVDDILDTGTTLAACAEKLRHLGAAEVKACVLLDKQRPRPIKIQADWIGFPIADEFVVGYGLDYHGRYRSLRDICVLDPAKLPLS